MFLVATLLPILVPIAQHLDKNQSQHQEFWSNIGGYWASLFYISVMIIVVWSYLIYACFTLYEKRKKRFVRANRATAAIIQKQQMDLYAVESEIERIKNEVSDRRPKLAARAEQTMWCTVIPHAAPNVRHTQLLIALSISNTGKPSITKDWQFTGERKGMRFAQNPHAITSETVMTIPGRTIKIPPEDALYEKTDYTPIPEGGRVLGWMRWIFEGIGVDDFMKEASDLAIEFLDVENNKVRLDISNRLGGDPYTHRHLPGIANPFSGMNMDTGEPVPRPGWLGSTIATPQRPSSEENENPA